MQHQILNILDIMKDLVSVQSDTGTKMEENTAERIDAYFREDSYLSSHPDHWGLADTNDFLGRRVVWALKEGTSRKTLILTGHYDAWRSTATASSSRSLSSPRPCGRKCCGKSSAMS